MGVGPLRRAVFLDRDGVLNRAVIREGKPYPPASVETMEMVPDAPAALAALRAAGFLLLVVTNQPDIARGTQSRAVVDAIHAALSAQLPVDEFLVCPHDDADACPCRKPKPGLLVEAAARYGIDLAASFLIGDRWRDVEAGQAAGCRTIFLDFGYAERGPHHPADLVCRSLSAASEWILASS